MSSLINSDTINLIQLKINHSLNLGLKNINNSCYVNSAIQFFLHSKSLYIPLIKTFGNINLIDLRKKFCEEQNINEFIQYDSKEFLFWLLDKCEKYKNNWYINLKQIRKCGICNGNKIKKDQEYIWFTNINFVDVESLLSNEVTMDEYIAFQTTSNVELKCDSCKKNTLFKSKTIFKKTSKHLFIDLQQNPDYIKSDLKLHIEKELFVKTKYYRLKGIMIHQGIEFYGHYFCFINQSFNDDNWICYNDDKVITGKNKIVENLCNGTKYKNTHIRILWYTCVDDDDDDNQHNEDTNNFLINIFD